MKTEKEKMLSGEMYNPLNKVLLKERRAARLLLKDLNDCREDDFAAKDSNLRQLIPNLGKGCWIQTPFFCDYGYNIHLGDKIFFNFNCTILDVMPVKIGSRTFFGPNVQVYTAIHPLNAFDRASGLESAKSVVIGADCWIGGGAIICPGVTIGDRTVIGAGSVVTKDIPSDVLAVGNPCRVIRPLNETEI